MSETKLFEELFSSVYVWTFFRKRGGGLPDSKGDEVLFLLWLRHFPRKRREDGQNPNTLRNLSSFKIRF